MRFTRTKAIIATAGLALSMAACGNAGEEADGPDVEAAENAADNFDDGTHLEQSQGGVAIQNGSNEVAVSMMDPVNWINEGGIRFMSQTTGSTGGWPYGIVLSSDTIAQQEGLTGSDLSFSKSGSIGDLEVLCNNAPVQIGNRVWRDINGTRGGRGAGAVEARCRRVPRGHRRH